MAVTAEQLREWVTNAGLGESEVELRIVASRQYYAAFHKCRRIAQAQGIFADAGGTHAQVIDALTRNRDMKLKSVGYKLKLCRNARAQADYDIDRDFTRIDAEAMKERCAAIWEQVNRMSGSAPVQESG